MNNKEEILKYINDTYENNSFLLGKFRIPKRIGLYLDVQQCRDNLLHSRCPGELAFINDFLKVRKGLKADRAGTFFEQFPIPIDNKDMWKESCKKFDVWDRTMMKKRLLLPDLYLPYYNAVIEIDYPSTHIKSWDNVRDDYLYNRFDITTYRINLYKESSDMDKYHLDSIKFILRSTKEYITNKPYKIFDYREFYVRDFEETFRDILDGRGNPSKLYKSYFTKKKEVN